MLVQEPKITRAVLLNISYKRVGYTDRPQVPIYVMIKFFVGGVVNVISGAGLYPKLVIRAFGNINNVIIGNCGAVAGGGEK